MSTPNTQDKFASYRREFRAEAEAVPYLLPSRDHELIRERLYRMIQYAIDRHDWYETQRHRFLMLSIGLLGVVATLSPVLASLAADMPLLIVAAAVVSLLWISITGFRMILIYARLIGPRYPFRQLTDIRSWIFRYNFSAASSAPSLSTTASMADAQVRDVLDAFKNFSNDGSN